MRQERVRAKPTFQPPQEGVVDSYGNHSYHRYLGLSATQASGQGYHAYHTQLCRLRNFPEAWREWANEQRSTLAWRIHDKAMLYEGWKVQASCQDRGTTLYRSTHAYLMRLTPLGCIISEHEDHNSQSYPICLFTILNWSAHVDLLVSILL